MTPSQRAFKDAWRKKATAKVSSRDYTPNVENWLCPCGTQELDAFHCCKHLVQSVPLPPASFFTYIVRRRVTPLFRHPALFDKAGPPRRDSEGEMVDRSVSNGDDHVWLGDKSVLANGRWRDLDKGHLPACEPHVLAIATTHPPF